MLTRRFPLRTASIALLAGLTLGGCGYGYGGLGGGISVGYGNSGYNDQSYYSGYSGNPYWGWNSGYYYPGTGYYVYDSYRRPHRWNSSQQQYWTNRQTYWRGRGDRSAFRENWYDFSRDRRNRDGRRDRRR